MIADEMDASHRELAILIDVDREVYEFLLFIVILHRYSSEVHVASCAVQLLQIIEALHDRGFVVHLPRNQPEDELYYGFAKNLIAGDLDIAYAILLRCMGS